MDRERAKRLISRIVCGNVDEVSTDELESMRSGFEEQMRGARMKGVYAKILDALDSEIEARSGERARISP